MRSAPLALYWKAIEALDRQDASAIRLLKAAAAGLSSQDNPEEFKAVNYHLGRILEDEGDMESSGKYYIEILAMITYTKMCLLEWSEFRVKRNSDKRLQALSSLRPTCLTLPCIHNVPS